MDQEEQKFNYEYHGFKSRFKAEVFRDKMRELGVDARLMKLLQPKKMWLVKVLLDHDVTYVRK